MKTIWGTPCVPTKFIDGRCGKVILRVSTPSAWEGDLIPCRGCGGQDYEWDYEQDESIIKCTQCGTVIEKGSL